MDPRRRLSAAVALVSLTSSSNWPASGRSSSRARSRPDEAVAPVTRVVGTINELEGDRDLAPLEIARPAQCYGTLCHKIASVLYDTK